MERPLVWLHGEVKTPPFSQEARIAAGVLLRGGYNTAKCCLCRIQGPYPASDVGAMSCELMMTKVIVFGALCTGLIQTQW